MHRLTAGHQASQETRERLSQWARGKGAGKAATAAGAFFKQIPGVRPRTAAEAQEMRAQEREDYVDAHTRVVPGKFVTRVLNGVTVVEPMREWFTGS